MFEPAVLRTLTPERPFLGGLHLPHVVLAGDHVDLATELRHPEAVNDVVGVDTDLEGPAHGDVYLVGGGEVQVGVLHRPPPPFADHFDPERVLLGLAEVVAGLHGRRPEHEEDGGGHDDAADPDERAVAHP